MERNKREEERERKTRMDEERKEWNARKRDADTEQKEVTREKRELVKTVRRGKRKRDKKCRGNKNAKTVLKNVFLISKTILNYDKKPTKTEKDEGFTATQRNLETVNERWRH